MKLSIVIPTRGDQNMKNITECLERQTFKDFEVIFVIDKHLTEVWEFISEDHRIYFITNLNSTFRSKRDANDPMIGGNASQSRNYGIKTARGEFILLMDDDEWFEDDYLRNYLSLREKYRKLVWQDFVLCPTLMYRKTGHVQNYWFSHYDYRMSRPVPAQMGDKERIAVQMYSWNSLLAPACIFQDHLFDERLDFVAEDLDFTRGITFAGIPMIVLRDLKICHMEREKNILENARVWNKYSAYRKAKHRRIFVQKYASLKDKIKFYLLWFRGQASRLILKVLIYGKWTNRREIIKSIVKGTFSR